MTHGDDIQIALVTNIPAPYRIPLFDEVARRDGYNLTVYFIDVFEWNRSLGVDIGDVAFSYEFLTGGTRYSRTLDCSIGVNYGIFSKLHEQSPDTIVAIGYSGVSTWAAMGYAIATSTLFTP